MGKCINYNESIQGLLHYLQLYDNAVKKGNKKDISSMTSDLDYYIRNNFSHKYINYTEERYIEDLKKGRIFFIENMSAKEPKDEAHLLELANDPNTCFEEKLDGTREDFQIDRGFGRLFSRRISKKTNWYTENTHNFPCLTQIPISKKYNGTVLDGELTATTFKEISALCNCKWDEAIKRQSRLIMQYGSNPVLYNVFDIIYYKGICVMHLPLHKRKRLLGEVVNHLVNECGITNIVEHDYYTECVDIMLSGDDINNIYCNPKKYPHLYNYILKYQYELSTSKKINSLYVNALEYFDYIVYKGGEGIMLKPLSAEYYMKRGREYTKVKKFDTWDLVIMGFLPPTHYYEGKGVENKDTVWSYWEDAEDDCSIIIEEMTMIEGEAEGLFPVTKAYAKDWIGTIRYGVVITQDELQEWRMRNPKENPFIINHEGKCIIEVGECGGLTEEELEYFSTNQTDLLLHCIEVGANEQMKKTGALRHPRFMRLRKDKEWKQCTWKDHIH